MSTDAKVIMKGYPGTPELGEAPESVTGLNAVIEDAIVALAAEAALAEGEELTPEQEAAIDIFLEVAADVPDIGARVGTESMVFCLRFAPEELVASWLASASVEDKDPVLEMVARRWKLDAVHALLERGADLLTKGTASTIRERIGLLPADRVTEDHIVALTAAIDAAIGK